jgi:hypothetical protein
MLGHVRLISFKVFHQFRNGLLRFGKRLENSEPKRLAEVAKASRNQFQRRAGKCHLAHSPRISLYGHVVDPLRWGSTVVFGQMI